MLDSMPAAPTRVRAVFRKKADIINAEMTGTKPTIKII